MKKLWLGYVSLSEVEIVYRKCNDENSFSPSKKNYSLNFGNGHSQVVPDFNWKIIEQKLLSWI